MLRVARWAAVAGGGFGILIALVTPTIVGALSFFYAMLGATLFVPVLVALHARVNRRVEVTASIVAGAAAVLAVQVTARERAGQHLDAGDDRPAQRVGCAYGAAGPAALPSGILRLPFD